MASNFEEMGDDHKSEMDDDIKECKFEKFAANHFQANAFPYFSREVLQQPLLPLPIELGDDHKPEMDVDIKECNFEKFAANHFQANSSPYFSREVLQQPLLPLSDERYQVAALKIWAVLLRFMVLLHEPGYLAIMEEHDNKATPVSWYIKDPPSSDSEMIRYIIDYGILIPDLRDEIYCQLCKQLTHNSNNQSYLKGWELLCLCVGCFPPSENFVNYLLNFIRGGPPDYSLYCEERLQRTIKNGSRDRPPGSLEIEATKSKESLMLPVTFRDGKIIKVSIDSSTTCRELYLQVSEEISLVDQFGFMLDIHYCNRVWRLASGQHVMDAISRCEQLAISRGMNPDVTSCSLSFHKKIFAPWQPSEDPVATDLIYNQVVEGVKSEKYRFDKDDDLVMMVAQRYFVENGLDLSPDRLQSLLQSYIPDSYFSKPNATQIWTQDILNKLKDSYFSNINISALKVKEDIVGCVKSKWPLSFSLEYYAYWAVGPGLDKDYAGIVVNCTGVYVVDNQEIDLKDWDGECLLQLSFPEIASINSNRTDYIHRDLTILTDTGAQYTFTMFSPAAEDVKHIVETCLKPPQDQFQPGPTDLDAGETKPDDIKTEVSVDGEAAGVVDELDVNEEGAIANVVDDISSPTGELDANEEGTIAGVVDDISSPTGELDVNEGGAIAGVVNDISSPTGELDVNEGGAIAGVVDDINRPADELDVNEGGAIAGVVDDISRPVGELDVNEGGAIAGVVDDISRPVGELDVNEGGAIAGVIDDISRPAGELDVNEEGAAAVSEVMAPFSNIIQHEVVSQAVNSAIVNPRKAPTNWKKGPLLGAGAFGKVYKCYDKETGHEFAVKTVKLGILNATISKEVRALVTEMKMLQNLQHERIVQYYGSQNDDKVLSIFIEYMPGGSVKKLINEIGELQESLVKKYSRQVLLGLEYIHENVIIHRDIKAANVLRDTLGNVKLGDFGSSKYLLGSSFVGTPHYMAPEVINGEDYDGKADIWSLGCTAVEMLSGKPPFHELKPSAAIAQIAICEKPEYELPQTVSSSGKEFLALTFRRTAADRPSAENLLKHRFVKAEEVVADGVPDDINRPTGELDVNEEGPITGVVDDINRPTGELDVNEEGAVAGEAGDINRPPGELATADAFRNMLENMAPGLSIAGNVENLNVTPGNPAIENLFKRTDTELDEEPLFNVSDSIAFKSIIEVLEEYRIAFLVGSSPILKQTIGLSSLRDYREKKFNVLSLSSLSENDTAAIMDKCDECEKFVFLDEVFGLTKLNENCFDKVISVLKKVNRNNRLFFTLTPLAFHTCQNRLKTLLPNLRYMVIDLDDQEEFDAETKFKILLDINSRVEENPERIGFSEFEIEGLSQKDNPVFLECCHEYLNFTRFDREIIQLFLQPMDCLVKELMCLKEEWQHGYEVLVLVALCPEFSSSVKSLPKLMLNYMELINHNFELGEVYEICKKFNNSYLQKDFQFRHDMYRNAVLGTIECKEFLLANCPLSFICDMDPILVEKNFYREEHFPFYKNLSLLAHRFVTESEDNFSKLTNLQVWDSEEFRKIFNVIDYLYSVTLSRIIEHEFVFNYSETHHLSHLLKAPVPDRVEI